MGRSKTASIRFLEKVPIAGIPVRDLRTSDLIQHVRERRKSGAGPSTVREKEKRRSSIPMSDIMWFAVHSARRQGEITRVLFSDKDATTQTGVVRKLKTERMVNNKDDTFAKPPPV